MSPPPPPPHPAGADRRWLAGAPLARGALALAAGVQVGLRLEDPGRVALGLAVALVAGWLERRTHGPERARTAALVLLCVVGVARGAGAPGPDSMPGPVAAVRTTWPPPGVGPDPGRARPGEGVEVSGARRVLRTARAPGGEAEVRRVEVEPRHVRRLGAAPDGPLRNLADGLADLRRRAGERLARLPDPATAGLARALVLGDREGLPPGLADRFTRTGTRHLLALSGLHVGLVAWLVTAPLVTLVRRGLRRARGTPLDALARHPGLAPLAQGALLLLLVPLGGGGAPILRAAIALSLAGWAPLLPGRGAARHRVRAANLWGAALGLELFLDPRALGDLGLLLSYGATLGLVTCAAGTLARLRAALHARWPGLVHVRAVDRLGRARPTGPRVLVQRGLDGLRTGAGASAVAVLSTLPVTWAVFGEVAPVGALLTPLLLAPVAVLVLVGWLHVLSGGALGAGWLELSTRATLALLDLGDRLPATPLRLPERPVALVLLACGVTLACWRAPVQEDGSARGVAPCRRRSGVRARTRLAHLAWGALALPWTPGPRGLEVVALDVGHGTAVVWRAPGTGVWVYDAGSRDRSAVGPAALGVQLARWDPGAVTVVASHGDADHARGLGWVRERFPLRAWHGAPPDSRDGPLPRGTPRVDLARGAVDLAQGGAPATRVRLLRGVPTEDNEGSRDLLVECDGARVLLTGDAEDVGWWALFERDLPRGPLDLLLLPHHGADAPALPELLRRTRPRRAWISASGPHAPPLPPLPPLPSPGDPAGPAERTPGPTSTPMATPAPLAIPPGGSTGTRGLLRASGVPWEATWRDGPLEFRSKNALPGERRGNPAEEGG